MALEKIIEFDKNNRYKVKLEVGNVDTSTVDSVEIDEEIAYLSQEDRHTFSFWTLENYKTQIELDYDDYLDCEFSLYRFWYVILEDGKLVVKNTNHYEELLFEKENFPEDMSDMSSSDLEEKVDTDAKYDILITYENLVEKKELDNLFSDDDKAELEKLKVDIKDNYYSVASVPVEVDWEMCKGYARETGVSDEYLTEVNLNRALELALLNIANQYSFLEDCFFLVKDDSLHIGTKIADYEDTAGEDIETIGKLTLEKDDLGILRLYVSGEMQDDLSKVKEYTDLIARNLFYVKWFKQQKETADTYIQKIDAKIKNILPNLMDCTLDVAKIEKNKEWIVKKIELAEELEQAVELYLKTQREARNWLEDEVGKKFEIDVSEIFLYLDDDFEPDLLGKTVSALKETLVELQLSKRQFYRLQMAEAKFEGKLRTNTGRWHYVLVRVGSKLEKLLSEHSDNEKRAQEIEEALALTKQPKLRTAQEQMVSAWNKYIGLKMEGEA